MATVAVQVTRGGDARVQAAVDAAAAAGGGTVVVPNREAITAPFVLRSRVRLVGEGWASALRLVDGANTHLVALADAQTEQVGIEQLRLDGNSAHQTAGNVVHLDNTGFDNGAPAPSLGDPYHYLHRVVIIAGRGHGVYCAGDFQGGHYSSVIVKDCDGDGFHLAGPDNHLSGCVAVRSGLTGFAVVGNSNRLLDCKAFLAGRVDVSAGHGFAVTNVSRADLTHCEAQDNRRFGFALNNTAQTTITAGRADRNGLGPEPVVGWGGDGIYAAGVTSSKIDLVAGDRAEGGVRLQRWAYNCGPGNSGNLVSIAAGSGADSSRAGTGSFGATSTGTVLWNGVEVGQAFA